MTYFLSIKNIRAGSTFSANEKKKNNDLNYCGVCLLRLEDQLLPSKHEPFPMGISLNDPESITVSRFTIYPLSQRAVAMCSFIKPATREHGNN